MDSNQLLSRLQQTAGTPQQRLLGLFDALSDWLDSAHPPLRSSLESAQHDPALAELLLDYLTVQARASGAAVPEALAQQLYFMALGILQEALRSPGCNNIYHARQAALALITAQTTPVEDIAQTRLTRAVFSRPVFYGMATSLAVMIAVSGLLFFHIGNLRPQSLLMPTAASQQKIYIADNDAASPAQTAEIYAVIEQMRKGVCQFPEALSLPASQRALYIENVIQGQISTSASEQATVKSLIQQVRCDYAPMLMKNSTG